MNHIFKENRTIVMSLAIPANQPAIANQDRCENLRNPMNQWLLENQCQKVNHTDLENLTRQMSLVR